MPGSCAAIELARTSGANSMHPPAVSINPKAMEYRLLGHSGLKVSALSFGAATFGGGNEFFKAWGSTQVDEAKRLLDLCLDAGVNLVDVANVYSAGLAEEVLGQALK